MTIPEIEKTKDTLRRELRDLELSGIPRTPDTEKLAEDLKREYGRLENEKLRQLGLQNRRSGD